MATKQRCARCGHAVRHPPRPGERVRRVLGFKAERRQCGARTDNGWDCPCRSRFHAS